MTGLFNYMLWCGAVLCFICYSFQTHSSDKSNLYLGLVIIGVIFITAIFNFQQQSKASAIMAQFKDFIPKEAIVYRDGK
jgi:sodium/potassium-transporting ATPase subunit alpha